MTVDLRAVAIEARVAAERADADHDAHVRDCRDCLPPRHACAEGAALYLAILQASAQAWAAHDAALPPGSIVTYDGTKEADRGDGWTVERVSTGCLGSGYTIRRDGRALSRVRLEHLTPEE